MLHAARCEMESTVRVQLLSIREKELNFFTRNCNAVAQASALLAGFGYTGLIYTKYIDNDLCDRNEIMCAEATYPLCVTITMCFALFSLWGSMLISMLAPVLALKGPQGSLDKAVDIVIQEYQYVLFLFACSIVMLFISAVMWSLTQSVRNGATVVTLISVGSVYLIYLSSLRTLIRFDVPPYKLVTGRFSAGHKAEAEQSSSLLQRMTPAKWTERISSPAQRGYHRLDSRSSAVPPQSQDHPRPPRQGRASSCATHLLPTQSVLLPASHHRETEVAAQPTQPDELPAMSMSMASSHQTAVQPPAPASAGPSGVPSRCESSTAGVHESMLLVESHSCNQGAEGHQGLIQGNPKLSCLTTPTGCGAAECI